MVGWAPKFVHPASQVAPQLHTSSQHANTVSLEFPNRQKWFPNSFPTVSQQFPNTPKRFPNSFPTVSQQTKIVSQQFPNSFPTDRNRFPTVSQQFPNSFPTAHNRFPTVSQQRSNGSLRGRKSVRKRRATAIFTAILRHIRA